MRGLARRDDPDIQVALAGLGKKEEFFPGGQRRFNRWTINLPLKRVALQQTVAPASCSGST